MDKLEAQPESLITFDLAVTPDHHAIVTIAGELDLGGIAPLDARVRAALADGVTRLTVDVSDLRFADSSAIALWVRWAGAVDHFELVNPAPLLRRVIAAMGLTAKLGAQS
jgi:anti-anti-sigma factor